MKACVYVCVCVSVCVCVGEGNGTPLQYSCLEGCSPWGRYELDTTERLHFHVLEKETAAHSSVLAWRIPGTEEPGGLLSWAAIYGVAQSRT